MYDNRDRLVIAPHRHQCIDHPLVLMDGLTNCILQSTFFNIAAIYILDHHTKLIKFAGRIKLEIRHGQCWQHLVDHHQL